MNHLEPGPSAATPSRRARVLVVVPRWTPRDDPGPQGVPFRTFTLASAFLAAGHEVVFFDQEHDLDRTDRFGELELAARDATAAFLWMNEMYPFHQCTNVWQIATRLKRSRPDLPIVVGGEFITVCPPELFDVELPVDWFLRGYGERSGLALIDCLLAGRPPDGVPGLVRRTGTGLRHEPPDAKPDFLPSYLEMYARIDLRPYVQVGGVFGNDQPTLTIGTGRGCVKGCAFCCWSLHPSRILAAEHVVALVRDLRQRYGVKQYHIGELDFFTSQQRVLRVAELMREQAPDCWLFALGSPCDLVRLTDTDWDLLYAGGFRKLELGSESGSTRLLRAIGKRHGPEDVFAISKKMIERGMVPMNNFLFGFPGETSTDRRQTLRLIDRLWKISPERMTMTFRYYQPCWGTPLGEQALAACGGGAATILEFLAYRHAYDDESARTMPWLDAADEREVKMLVNHHLPLVTSKLALHPRWRQRVYRALRARAERRLGAGAVGRPWDRWLYDRVIGARLDCTFTP